MEEPGRAGGRKVYHRADVVHGKCEWAPCQLEAVQFHGVRNTKTCALLKEVSYLYKCKTVDELVKNSHIAAKHLQEVGLMENAAPIIDTSATGNGYIVNFVVKEPKPFTLGAKLGISSQGDADMSMHGGKQSVRGQGEALDAAYSYTLKGDHNFNVGWTKPLLGWQRYENVGASLSRSLAFLPWNKCNVEENALVAFFNRHFYERKMLFSSKVNAIWRTLRATPETSFFVREHAGHTLKMSLENSAAFDTRDRPILPSKGVFARISQEIAGAFGLGDASFHRYQIDIQAAAPLFLGSFLVGSLRASAIDPIGSNEMHVLDRVYLGGQHDIRGFALNSIGGDRVEGCTVGGGSSVAMALHLFRPLKPADLLFIHGFVASGSVSSLHSRRPFRELYDSQRVSAGLGLCFVFKNIFRLELNYVYPLKFAPVDSFQQGIHFGAGVNFL